ncbi:MAG: hypothetical protein IJP62_11310 [Treponema sp.]|nr:hypothetical protein [Treponema sp.]
MEKTAEITRLEKYNFALKLLGGHGAEIESLDTELAELKDKRRACALELLPIVFSRVMTTKQLHCFLQVYFLGKLRKAVAANVTYKAYQVGKHCMNAIVRIFSAEPMADVFAPLTVHREKGRAINDYNDCLYVARKSIDELTDYFQFTLENRRALFEQILILQDRLNDFEESIFGV